MKRVRRLTATGEVLSAGDAPRLRTRDVLARILADNYRREGAADAGCGQSTVQPKYHDHQAPMAKAPKH